MNYTQRPLIPVGWIEKIIGNPPPGWVLCDGQELRREDYPELYELFKNWPTTTPKTFLAPKLNEENSGIPEGLHRVRHIIKADGR